MNILPKKRWHVRTKDNIARVRRDEAQAEEEDRKRQQKQKLAESEARINFLKSKSNATFFQEGHENIKGSAEYLGAALSRSQINDTQHLNLFDDHRSHVIKKNKASEYEEKAEKEKYEKQIGYLTYLGQDTNEALKLRSWYEVAPKRSDIADATNVEKDLKKKQSHDPLTLINSVLPASDSSTLKSNNVELFIEDCSISTNNPLTNKRKYEHEERAHKKHKKSKKRKKDKKSSRKLCYTSESNNEEMRRIKKEKLETLRKDRLLREARERVRQEAILASLVSEEKTNTETAQVSRVVQKYNSQFNPKIAKQNMK